MEEAHQAALQLAIARATAQTLHFDIATPTASKIRLDLNRWENMRVERTGMNHEEQRETISQVLLYFTNMSEANGLSDSPSHDLLQSAQRALRNRNTGWVSTISQTPRQ